MSHKKLILHIGHPKTGSSALQSFFSLENEALEQQGVKYPNTDKHLDAVAGRISAGNGSELQEYYKTIQAGAAETVLISSELLFYSLLEKEFRHNLHEHARKVGLSPEYVLYTRDFFEFAFSGWGQYIKRSRGTLDFASFMQTKDDVPFQLNGENFNLVKKWIDLSQSEGFELNIFNYERHKLNVADHFLAKALRLDCDDFDTEFTKNQRINRSLTLAEYELQRQFNLNYPKYSADFISDVLVNELPNIPSEIPNINRNTYDEVVQRYADVIDEINTFLDPAERVLITPFNTLKARFPNSGEAGLIFTSEQLSALAIGISNKLMTNVLPKLSDHNEHNDHINLLRRLWHKLGVR